MYDLVFIHTGFDDNELAWVQGRDIPLLGNRRSSSSAGHHLGRAREGSGYSLLLGRGAVTVVTELLPIREGGERLLPGGVECPI